MTWQWLALAGLAIVALGLLVALVRLRARTTADIAAARHEAVALRERLDLLDQERQAPSAPMGADTREYRITGLGEAQDEAEHEDAVPVRPERAVFADLLLRESVIRLGSLGHGVRRAMSAETRNRIRFEMKREVKRARKQRRADQREAYRDWQARQRSQVDTGDDRDLRESA